MLTVGKVLEGMTLSEFARIRVTLFIMRLMTYIGIVAAGIWLILHLGGWFAVLGSILLGLMYAHAVELQHQALHHTAFPSKAWNRFAGFLLGLPMLVSYSDYQYHHFHHHRLLGTPENREFFNYGYDRLTSLKPLLAHLLMLSHYRDVSKFILWSLMGRLRPGVKREAALRIRTEYCLMGGFIALVTVLSIVFKAMLFLKVWFLPLLVAIPTHALIELPEHWGKEQQIPNVLINTRTIRAGWFAYWFTNGNNFHIEHHWLPSVPNDRFRELHKLIEHEIESETYPQFYKKFFGELYRNTFTRTPREGQVTA